MNYIQHDWWSEKETAVKAYTPINSQTSILYEPTKFLIRETLCATQLTMSLCVLDFSSAKIIQTVT